MSKKQYDGECAADRCHVLHLLSLMIERHGYAIMKYIEELSNQSITMGPGTLYTLLKKLCRAEWILQTSVTADRTKKYQITDTGRQVLLHEVARRKRMVEADCEYWRKRNMR